MKIDKPPVCQKLLQNGKKYRLISEPEAEITPEVYVLKTTWSSNRDVCFMEYFEGFKRMNFVFIFNLFTRKQLFC